MSAEKDEEEEERRRRRMGVRSHFGSSNFGSSNTSIEAAGQDSYCHALRQAARPPERAEPADTGHTVSPRSQSFFTVLIL